MLRDICSFGSTEPGMSSVIQSAHKKAYQLAKLSLALPTITDFSIKRNLVTVRVLQSGLAVPRTAQPPGVLSVPRPRGHRRWAKGPESATWESLPLLLDDLATEALPPSFEITFENVRPSASLLRFLTRTHLHRVRTKATISSVLHGHRAPWRWATVLSPGHETGAGGREGARPRDCHL